MKWTKDQVLTDVVCHFIKNKVNQINVSLDLRVPLCYLPTTCGNWWARLNRQWCRSRCWSYSAEAVFSHTIMHPCQTSHFSWDSPIFYHSIPLSSCLNIFLYFSSIFNLAIKKSHWAYFMFSTFTSGKTPVIFMALTSFYEQSRQYILRLSSCQILYETHPPHTIDTYKFQPICPLNLATLQPSDAVDICAVLMRG